MTTSSDKTKDSHALLRDALNTLKIAGVTQLVLDLRGNIGGGQSRRMASLFVKNEPLWFVRRAGKDEPVKRQGELFGRTFKLAVLVNEETLSAAEMLAFCLQKHGVATVVGQPTGGALTSVTRLAVPNGFLHFPSGLVIAPDGSVPARHRVAPDVEIPNCSVADLIAGRDPQLDAALSALRSH